MLLAREATRRDAASAPGRPFARASSRAGFLPFLIADPGALWRDTISYGAGTYRILGYGLSALLLTPASIDDRYGAYPFASLALLVWLPVTVWLARGRSAARERAGRRPPASRSRSSC